MGISMVGNRYCLAFLLLLLPLFNVACAQTCEVLCSENARHIDGCLEYWAAVWPDLGYDGLYDYDNAELGVTAQDPYEAGPSQEYIERCNERYGNAVQFGGPEFIRTVKVGCRDDLSALSESVTCDDYVPNDVLDPTEGNNGTAPRPDE